MKLLANENIPAALTRSLRAAGHNVNWVSEISPGITDTQVIELAIQQDRILVTFDKDFGELAFRRSLPATCQQCEGVSKASEQRPAIVNNRFSAVDFHRGLLRQCCGWKQRIPCCQCQQRCDLQRLGPVTFPADPARPLQCSTAHGDNQI